MGCDHACPLSLNPDALRFDVVLLRAFRDDGSDSFDDSVQLGLVYVVLSYDLKFFRNSLGGFGEIGSMSNYAHLPAAVKFSNMFEMILGRLEIYPIVSLLASFRRASS